MILMTINSVDLIRMANHDMKTFKAFAILNNGFSEPGIHTYEAENGITMQVSVQRQGKVCFLMGRFSAI